jgi:hypothetical protein
MANFFMDATHQKESYKFMDVPPFLYILQKQGPEFSKSSLIAESP